MGTVFMRDEPVQTEVEVYQDSFPTVLRIPKIYSKFTIGEDREISVRQVDGEELTFVTLVTLSDETIVTIYASSLTAEGDYQLKLESYTAQSDEEITLTTDTITVTVSSAMFPA